MNFKFLCNTLDGQGKNTYIDPFTCVFKWGCKSVLKSIVVISFIGCLSLLSLQLVINYYLIINSLNIWVSYFIITHYLSSIYDYTMSTLFKYF